MKSILAIAFFLAFACSAGNVNLAQNNKDKDMLSFANNEYDKEWEEIKKLEKDGLIKSALEKVESLYVRVVASNNPAQLVKCVIFRENYNSQLNEDGLFIAIEGMKTEIEKASFPANAILQSALAEMYNRYLNNYLYKIQGRTKVSEGLPEDMKTWATEDFISEINTFYLMSVADERLESVLIDNFNAILHDGQSSTGLRSSLYDFLMHRAIDRFVNGQALLNEPVYKFHVDQAEAFSDVKQFVSYSFESKQKDSDKLKALQLFQKLLSYKLEENNELALLDANLKRLKFVNSVSVHPEKNTLYKQSLENLLKSNADNEGYSEICYHLGSYYFNQNKSADSYSIAHSFCKNGIEQFPNSFGAKQCKNLLNEIENKHLNLQLEEINLPKENLLSLLKFRNIEKVYFKIISNEGNAKKQFERGRGEKMLNWLNGKKEIRSWSVDLPRKNDFKEHSIEIKVGPLELGEYFVLVSDHPNFRYSSTLTSYIFFQVSNISYYKSLNAGQDKSELLVLHRNTGLPLEDVKVDFYTSEYDASLRRNKKVLLSTDYTSKDGFVQIPKSERNAIQPIFTYGVDVLDYGKSLYNQNYNNNPRENERIEFFLDRGIYRPGQQIYFKGLVYTEKQGTTPRIKPNQKVTVIFKDANYQKVSSLDLVSNEYGSINGSFTVPSSGLLGNMRIQSGNSSKNFKVEEYKRPKFEVSFDKIEGEFNLGDQVKVTANAKAFAGYPIDGAAVSYRIERTVRYPYWRYYWNWRQEPALIIKNGNTTTDSNGKFEIVFDLVADPSSDPKRKPIFNYKVYADVLDISGETRSGNTAIKAGYVSLEVDFKVDDIVNLDSLREVQIDSRNLNGNKQDIIGELTIEKLSAAKKVFRKRYWTLPDTTIYSEMEFENFFDSYSLKEENKIENLSVDKLVESATFNTAKKSSFDLSKIKNPGQYKITISTKDKNGTPVKVEKYMEIFDSNSEVMSSTSDLWMFSEDRSYEPGEKVDLILNSSLGNSKVLLEIERSGKKTERKWLDIKDLEKIQIPISEEDRGNLFYHLTTVSNNRVKRVTKQIMVPWSNKELKITYGTFRDKLLPGENEEWVIKVSGPKKDKVAAEFLAGMYDASLDDFATNSWSKSFYSNYYSRYGRANFDGFSQKTSVTLSKRERAKYFDVSKSYDSLNWFGFHFWNMNLRSIASLESTSSGQAGGRKDRKKSAAMRNERVPMAMSDKMEVAEGFEAEAVMDQDAAQESAQDETKEEEKSNAVRTNLKETVFFFPDLNTDSEGNVVIKFKMNEALTKWKFMGFAHTKDFKYAFTEKEIVTQKELMVQPNAPRFFREGDKISYTGKVINLSDKVLKGTAKLLLFDALSMKPLDTELGNTSASIEFELPLGASRSLSWDLSIPLSVSSALIHRVVVEADGLSDGEESAVPVLTNRMLVTETMPLPIRAGQQKTFVFESLKNNNSKTLKHHNFSLEFTSNPAWYAVQALPYMMEYPYDCTEQVFSRLYANALATHVANSHPKIQTIFESWKGTDAMKSNLSKNQELKTALLEETPWVLDAQSEEQQKQNIALLFDMNKMSHEFDKALATIKDRQLSNGGFSWFPGGRDSWYISQYLLEGFGHLRALGIDFTEGSVASSNMTEVQIRDYQMIMNKTVKYVDDRVVEYYNKLRGESKDALTNMIIHYLYARSFFQEVPFSNDAKKIHAHYVNRAKELWVEKGIYEQGMLCLTLNTLEENSTANKIVASLSERALQHDELGMYWKYNSGYYWYQMPIETHSLMIEVFEKVAKDKKAVDELRLWLLKNKQTNNWKTTKATSSAVYALLLSGDNWLTEDKPVDVIFTNKLLNQQLEESRKDAEAGTGYFKHSWDTFNPQFSTVKVVNNNSVAAWGSAYWQYFEDLDNITSFEKTPLTLKKGIYKEVRTDADAILKKVDQGSSLKPGDKLIIRIELRVDRDMEYIHMKDMRASGLEPMNVLSQYKWQGGLGYYESTKDASTNFFFDFLPKGTYVFEYPLRVVHEGDFSNGITTIQSMYAPEFTSHSMGERVLVGGE